MPHAFLSRAALILVSTTLAVLGVACRENKYTTAKSGNEQRAPIVNLAALPPVTTVAPASPEIEPSFFDLGLDKASGALSISQSAQSPEDWNLVASQFKDALKLMKKVERQSPYFAIAQTKIPEYNRQIQFAQQKATVRVQVTPETKQERIIVVVPQPKGVTKITPSVEPKLSCSENPAMDANQNQCPEKNITQKQLPETPPLTPLPQPPNQQLNEEQEVFSVPIKRRMGGTPIIEVTFNGNQRFDMIVDTGASGTVITQEMANVLGVVVVAKAKANTASSKAVEFPIGYVETIEVAGLTVNKVGVAIAGSELETGLLGHDFFGNYDLTIKRDVVEFRLPSDSQINSRETGLIPLTIQHP